MRSERGGTGRGGKSKVRPGSLHLPREELEPWTPAGNRRLTLVAEESPPALLAGALPGLLAGAMETARVPNALVTVAALPAHSAPEGRKDRVRGASTFAQGDKAFPTHRKLPPSSTCT